MENIMLLKEIIRNMKKQNQRADNNSLLQMFRKTSPYFRKYEANKKMQSGGPE